MLRCLISCCSSTEGVVHLLFQELHARGQLFSKHEAMCQIQVRHSCPLHHNPLPSCICQLVGSCMVPCTCACYLSVHIFDVSFYCPLSFSLFSSMSLCTQMM